MTVSVVIPCFNYAQHLPAAVAGALREDVLEVVIVDDGSTDGSLEVAHRLAAEHDAVRVVAQANRGPAAARNTGVAAARGELVLCLDADDELAPGYVAACLTALERSPSAAYAYPDQQNIGARTDFEPHPAYDWALLQRFNFILSSALFPKAAWEAVGGMDEDAGYEDWDFWLKLGEHGHHGVHAPGAVLLRRVHGSGVYAGDVRRDGEIKARIVLRHPALYDDAQRAWAEAVLRGDPSADNKRLGVIPQFDRLHVLFAMTGWADGGGGTILPRQIAKALVRRGHRVTVLSAPVKTMANAPAYHVETAVEDGVQLVSIYNRPSLFNDPENPEREVEDPAMRHLLAALIGQLKPDVAHVHSLLGFSLALGEELDRAGVASVFTSHNYWPLCPRMYLFRDDFSLCDGPSDDGGKCGTCVGRPGKAPLFARRHEAAKALLGRHVDRHLAVSSRVRELYVSNGHAPERVHVLLQQPESVEWIWDRAGSQRAIAARLERPLRVGFIGSLLPQKGMHVLAAALQRFAPGELECHVFGDGPQEYVGHLRNLDRNGLLRLHGGYRPEQLAELLAGVDVVCVPSVWEDCAPLVVAEALASRAPVVASRIGGIPDFIADGETGLVVAPRQPGALAAALRRFLDDPGLLGRMQAAIPRPRGFGAYLDDLETHYRGALTDRRERAGRVDGTRSFAALAYADDLVAEPALLREYAASFSADDDATLVVHVPAGDTDPLSRAIDEAGLGADVLAVVGPADRDELRRRTDAVYSRGTTAVELRRLAERRWAQPKEVRPRCALAMATSVG